jgi:multidrug efflux pump subunit AcrA (membrane-fusion protein)
MRPKTVVVNTSLAIVLLAAAVGAVLQVADPAAPKVVEQTAVVTKGAVTATVAAAGNIGSPHTVGLPFAGQPGLVKALYTEIGKTVQKGDKLAQVDDRSARNQLAHAKASVAAAEAQIMAAKEGQTPAEAKLDQANIEVALRQMYNARDAVGRARKKLASDTTSQDALVQAAADVLERTYNQLSNSTQETTSGDWTETVGTIPPNPTQGSSHQQKTHQHTSSTTESALAIEQSRQLLVQAGTNRAATLLADYQDVRKLSDDAELTQRQVEVAKAQHLVNAQLPKPDKLASAEAQLAEAQAQVLDAQLALDNTLLVAPFKGTVVDIAGGVGETPLAAARGTTASSAVPVGPGSAENRSAATQSGFVIIADMTHQYVTAEVNEADITKVAKGQSATVTFPATGQTLNGTVDSVDEQETVVNNVVEYKVQIAVDTTTPLRPGQSTSVQIVTANKTDALSVPSAAIIPVGSQNIVALRRDKQIVKVPVTVGLVGDATTEITGDLRPGDVVILPTSGGLNIAAKPATAASNSKGLSVK